MNRNGPISFKVKRSRDYTLIEFELIREITPEDLSNIEPPDPVKEGFSSSVVILSGRGPVWLYGYLIHFYHPTKAIAVFDPRLDAGVVVETHVLGIKVGDLIKKEVFDLSLSY